MNFPQTSTLTFLSKLPEGSTNTIAGFFEQYVKPHLPAPNVVKHWHQLLLQYVRLPDAVLLARRYHNWAPGEGDESLRRGFLSIDPTGFGYVFGDNVLPQFVAGWVMAGQQPSLDEWRAAVHNCTLPVVGTRFVTQAERKHNVFALAPTMLGTKGWKLAHLHSVNGRYRGVDYRTAINRILPRGKADDWNTPDHIRRLSHAIAPDDRAVLVAHFLRAVHPLNYFLSPGTRHQLTKPDIGEDARVHQYVRQQFGRYYGFDMLEELEDLLLIPTQPAPVALLPAVLSLTVQWQARKTVAAASSRKIPTVSPLDSLALREVWALVRDKPATDSEIKIGAALQHIIRRLSQDDAGFAALQRTLASGHKLALGEGVVVFRPYTDDNSSAELRKDNNGYNRYYASPLTRQKVLFCSQWNYRRHFDEWTRLLKAAGLI